LHLTFTRGDVTPPNHRVLVLSFRTWQNHFGSDPGVIVGVMPAGFQFPLRDGDAWQLFPENPQTPQERGQHVFTVVGRLRPGVSLDVVGEQVNQASMSFNCSGFTSGDPAAELSQRPFLPKSNHPRTELL
jgi:hypothetical protein